MKVKFIALALGLMLGAPFMAHAHSALFDCFDNGDGTIYCQGGYSDGSSAKGVKINVTDAAGRVLEQGQLDDNSEVTLKKPTGDYFVVFEGGEGHSLKLDGKNIVE